jgi:hypothetical protein
MHPYRPKNRPKISCDSPFKHTLTKRIEKNVLGQDISLGHNAFEKTLEPIIGTPTAADILACPTHALTEATILVEVCSMTH